MTIIECNKEIIIIIYCYNAFVNLKVDKIFDTIW